MMLAKAGAIETTNAEMARTTEIITLRMCAPPDLMARVSADLTALSTQRQSEGLARPGGVVPGWAVERRLVVQGQRLGVVDPHPFQGIRSEDAKS
jgi:hypothetical protein